MREVEHLINRKQYKLYFVRDSLKDGYNLRLLAISRHPSHPSHLYTQAGDKFEYLTEPLRQRVQESIPKGVKATPLNPSNRHLLEVFFVKLI